MSNPVQLPCASGMPKPGSAGFEPQTRKPFCLTLFSVACPKAPVAARLAVKPKAIATPEGFMVELQPYALKSLSKVAEAVLAGIRQIDGSSSAFVGTLDVPRALHLSRFCLNA